MDIYSINQTIKKSYFKKTQVSGCLFHLKQNLWDTVSKKGAIDLYNNEKTFQEIVDFIAALSYVRSDLVIPFFNEVIEPMIDKLTDEILHEGQDYFDYVVRTYIGSRAGRSSSRRAPLFRPELWSSFDDLLTDSPTTNNALESWNARWNSAKMSTSNFWSVVEGFQREDALAYQRYLSDISDVQNPNVSPVEGTSRKIKHRLKMSRLKNVALKINSVPPAEYLAIVSSIMRK